MTVFVVSRWRRLPLPCSPLGGPTDAAEGGDGFTTTFFFCFGFSSETNKIVVNLCGQSLIERPRSRSFKTKAKVKVMQGKGNVR